MKVAEPEVIIGEGHYRVTSYQGKVAMVEIWDAGVRMVFGQPKFEGSCARCGVEMAVYVPGNPTAEICTGCDILVAAEDGDADHR